MTLVYHNKLKMESQTIPIEQSRQKFQQFGQLRTELLQAQSCFLVLQFQSSCAKDQLSARIILQSSNNLFVSFLSILPPFASKSIKLSMKI